MSCRFFAFLGLVITLPLQAQEKEPPSHLAYDLTPDEQTKLAREKLLISRHEVKQSFSAYMDNRYPRFITSDAILNAYHVLFEETLRQQEILQARHLRTLCTELWRLLAASERMYQGDSAKIAAAMRRARFVIGVATRLLNEPLDGCEPDLQQAIEAEVKIIEKAEGQHKPALLGAPDPDFLALDDTLFQPVGFYRNSTALQHYFRALRWLQVVPFRAHHDEELLSFHMLEICTQMPVSWDDSTDVRLLPAGLDMATWDRLSRVEQHRSVFSGTYGLSPGWTDLFEQTLSGGDDLPVRVNASFFDERAQLLSDSKQKGKIIRNDRIRETMPDATKHEFRVLTDFKLPEDDALTFLSRIQGRPINQRSPGLEFAAWLSVPEAEQMLGKEIVSGLSPLRPVLDTFSYKELEGLPWWQQVRQGYPGGGLQYPAALRLLAEVDSRAPAFMQGEAWRTKTLQTVAASWAQNRHAWSLQSKPEVHVASAAPGDAGFVEPVPEFYRMLGSLAEILGHTAFDTEMKGDPVAGVVENLKEEARWLRDIASNNPSKDDLQAGVWSGGERLADYRGMGAGAWLDAENASAADLRKLADALEALGTDLQQHARPGTALWERVQEKTIHTARLWHKLQIVCLTLATLAEKQLQKVPLSSGDSQFLKGIGYDLSEIMLYRGQAMMFPPDDAPRITRIVNDPNTRQILHVGIGRPRLMFVLYPWEGREILCRGVVMPYHEVRDTKMLLDDAWQHGQKGKTRNGIPQWLDGLVPTKDIVFGGDK